MKRNETVVEIDHFPILQDPSFQAAFKKKVRIAANGCWIWLGAKDYDHYGIVRVRNAGAKRAHRVSYEMFKKERIPSGWDIDHVCGVRDCVNPDHLEAVLHDENMQRIKKHRVNDSPIPDPDQEEDAEENVAGEGEAEAASPEPTEGSFWARTPVQSKQASTPLQDRVLAEAVEWLEKKRIPAPKHRSDGYGIASRKDAPWREPKGKMVRVAVFLDVVRLGVPWPKACAEILGLRALSLSSWRKNPAWAEDFDIARNEGRANRVLLLEEQILSEMERKLPMADYKELAESLRRLREKDEKPQQEVPAPRITFVFNTREAPERLEERLTKLVELGEAIEAEYTALPERST
jgi:hypothetical protein